MISRWRRLLAKVHFVSGKGGVGKSFVAAGLAVKLANRNEGPVLLIDIQGVGRALKLLGLNTTPFQNTGLPETESVYGARILPRETFRQYFSQVLALGNENSSLAQLTLGLREKITDILLENRIVSAFVDACPGLEPATLLGKIHFEATEGCAPESETRWAHVVVDAPSTGHFLMLFKSTFAMMDVFQAGTVLKQAKSIREFALNSDNCLIHIVSNAEELPLQEAWEILKNLNLLGMKVSQFVINRIPPMDPSTFKIGAIKNPQTDWQREILLQEEIWKEQNRLIEEFISRFEQKPRISKIKETFHAASFEGVVEMEKQLSDCLS